MAISSRNEDEKIVQVALLGDSNTKINFVSDVSDVSGESDKPRCVDLSFTSIKVKDVAVNLVDVPNFDLLVKNQNDTNAFASHAKKYLNEANVFLVCCSSLDKIEETEVIYKTIKQHYPKANIVTYTPEMDPKTLILDVVKDLHPESKRKDTQKSDKKEGSGILGSLWAKATSIKNEIQNKAKQNEILKNQPTHRGVN